MNFDILPELHWEYGYLYFWITVVVIMTLIALIFTRVRLVSL